MDFGQLGCLFVFLTTLRVMCLTFDIEGGRVPCDDGMAGGTDGGGEVAAAAAAPFVPHALASFLLEGSAKRYIAPRLHSSCLCDEEPLLSLG